MEINTAQTVNKDQLTVLLRHFVKGHTEAVAARTGISERRIRSHMDHTGSCPNAVDLAQYMRVLGPQFTNAYLALIDQTGARECEAQFVSLHSYARLSSGSLSAVLAALEDGEVDHIEERSLPPVLLKHSYDSANAAFAIQKRQIAEIRA